MSYKKNKECIICHKEYIAHNWRSEVCSHSCHLARRRIWTINNKERVNKQRRYEYNTLDKRKQYYKDYEKTTTGFLVRKYRNMLSRIKGIQKQKFHLYKGKYILPKEKFYKWANNSTKFKKLFDNWVKSNYQRKLCPSVDRINPTKGYEVNNMEWVTMSENSRRGAIHRHQMKI